MIANPIAERIGHRLRRKPKLHIHVHPFTDIWCIASSGSIRFMQVRFTADITNDGNEGVLVWGGGYVKGTKPRVSFHLDMEIPPTSTVRRQHIALFVAPIIGKEGEDFTGRVILIDQFKRKHTTDKVTFAWIGPPEQPKAQPQKAGM